MPNKNVGLHAVYEQNGKNAGGLEGNMVDPYIDGYPDGTIQPGKDITRAETVKIIYNLYGGEVTPDTSVLTKFSDVSSNMWYSEAIAFAVEYNLVSGYPDGTFHPNQTISRDELSAMLDKLVKDDVPNPTTPFSDINNSWAKESIERLYTVGVISGYEDNTFRPNETASREDVVTLTNRLLGRPLTWNETNMYPDLPESRWSYGNMMNAANGSKVD